MRGNGRIVAATLFTALAAMQAWAGLIHEDNSGRANNADSGCIAPDRIDGTRDVNNACEPGRGNLGGARNPITFPQDDGMTLKSLGITNANELGILFDGTAPQAGTSETIKVYSGSTVIFSITGSFSGQAVVVNGQSEYLFNLDANSIGALNAAIAGNLGDSLVLESTNANGDVQGYSLVDVDALAKTPSSSTADDPTVPEPATFGLLAPALLGLAYGVRRKQRLAAQTK